MSILVGSMQVVFANFLLFFARTSGKSPGAFRSRNCAAHTNIKKHDDYSKKESLFLRRTLVMNCKASAALITDVLVSHQ